MQSLHTRCDRSGTKLVQTSYTDEAGFEVGHHVVRTRLLLMQGTVRYCHHTGLSAGAASIHLREDVRRASDVDVGVCTASVLHATVASRLHQNDGTSRAGRVERLPLTVLHHHLHTATATPSLSYMLAACSYPFLSLRQVFTCVCLFVCPSFNRITRKLLINLL